MYMPTTLDETLGSIVIAIDTSGSIDDRAINEFLSHVRVICTNLVPERVDLLYWDTDVAGHEVYKKEELDKLVHNTKPRGGGGTQVDCVFEYIEKVKLNPIVVLIMTDGYTPYPSVFARPVLWAMTSNVQAPWGKTIYIK
jgi:predicted metal-dependent peptidase